MKITFMGALVGLGCFLLFAFGVYVLTKPPKPANETTQSDAQPNQSA
jgi:hypothetical protein